jgi:hypothetical protein
MSGAGLSTPNGQNDAVGGLYGDPSDLGCGPAPTTWCSFHQTPDFERIADAGLLVLAAVVFGGRFIVPDAGLGQNLQRCLQ